jgi:hypothetical protein
VGGARQGKEGQGKEGFFFFEKKKQKTVVRGR